MRRTRSAPREFCGGPFRLEVSTGCSRLVGLAFFMVGPVFLELPQHSTSRGNRQQLRNAARALPKLLLGFRVAVSLAAGADIKASTAARCRAACRCEGD